MQPGWNVHTRLAEVFQREVSTQTEPDQIHRLRRMPLQRMADHRVQIFRRATVVHAQQAVRHGTAAAEIPCQDIPAAPHQRRRHALHVAGTRMRFQPVGQDRKPPPPLLRPFKIDEITVGQFKALGPHRHPRHSPTQRRHDRLQVPTRKPPRHVVG